MQSWGTQSRFNYRDSGREPSKSGVIGLLCAALGRPRSEPVTDLAALRMGVRVDREGSVKQDYHTAGGYHGHGPPYGVMQPDGKLGGTVLSWRFYLSDASFLVGLEGDDSQEGLLHELHEALAAPRWQLFLGRKAFSPGEPVRLPDHPPLGPGLRRESLEEALSAYPWVARTQVERDRPPVRLRLILDAERRQAYDTRGAEARSDVPISFAARTFATRIVQTKAVLVPSVVLFEEAVSALAGGV